MANPLNMTFNGERVEATEVVFGNQEDYLRARDLANRIPEFSGTPQHASFEQFDRALRDSMIAIPRSNAKLAEYMRAILNRILHPARLLLARKNPTTPEQILEILSKSYWKSKDFSFYTNEIQSLRMFDDESLEDFLRRLAVLVEYGLNAGVAHFGEEQKDSLAKMLHYSALKRFMEHAPFHIQEALTSKRADTIEKALDVLDQDVAYKHEPLYPTDRIPRNGPPRSPYGQTHQPQYNMPQSNYQRAKSPDRRYYYSQYGQHAGGNNQGYQPGYYPSPNRPRSPNMSYNSPSGPYYSAAQNSFSRPYPESDFFGATYTQNPQITNHGGAPPHQSPSVPPPPPSRDAAS